VAVTVEPAVAPTPLHVSISSVPSSTFTPPMVSNTLPAPALGTPAPSGASVITSVAVFGAGAAGVKLLPIGPECFPTGGASCPLFSLLPLETTATGMPAIRTKSTSRSVIAPS